MDPGSTRRILRNLVFFKENITQIGRVMDKLIELDVISMEEKAEILTEKSTDNQSHILLELMKKRGRFDDLIEALRVSGNGHIAERLLQTDIQQGSVKTGEKNLQVDLDNDNYSDVSDGLSREDTILLVDDKKLEIIQLIKERELHKMKYEELMKKYRKLKSANECKSGDIESLTEEVQELKSKLKESERQKREELDRVTSSLKDKVKPKMQTIRVGTDEIDGPIGKNITTQTGWPMAGDDDYVEAAMQESIEDLERQNNNLESLVANLENQISEQKTAMTEKDDRIMKLKNDIGKLQIYIEAGRNERKKLTQGLNDALAKHRKEDDERFDKLDGKMEMLLNIIGKGRGVRMDFQTKPSQKNLKKNGNKNFQR